MKTFLAIASAATVLTLGTAPAAAQASADVRSVVVSYGDLDLQSEGGRKALERRVRQAVERVCPSRPHIAQLQLNKVYSACHAHAWTGARQQLARVYGGARLASASIEVSGGD